MAITKHINPATLKRKRQAKYLIVENGMSQKETAKLVGVNAKTIGRWVKEYNWLAGEETLLLENAARPNSLIDFMVMLNNEYPKQYPEVAEIYEIYIERKPIN